MCASLLSNVVDIIKLFFLRGFGPLLIIVDISKVNFVTINKNKYDLIYLRYTFHSIINDQHSSFLDSIKDNTYLAIETRIKKGEDDYVYQGKSHYRNYTDIDYLKKYSKFKKF